MRIPKQDTNHVEKIKTYICLILNMFIAIAIMATAAIACQPCQSKLDLEQSLKKADLVIVGKRIDYDPEEKMPSTIKVNIIKVLKGEIKEAQIEVKSWYGMCGYGIVVDDQIYVMILIKSSEMQGVYTTVNGGCSVTQLLVKSNKVSVGGKSMSVEDIIEIINKKPLSE
jgi:hypothetical protein